MEKNRIRPIKTGKSFRMSYSRQKEVLEMPNLIEVQKDSYQWFLDEGLKEVFDDISPIADYSGHLSLEFVDFTLCEDDVKYTIDECKERDATYAAPLKVRVRLYNKETDEINEHEIFMGDLPLMTKTGTFVINGAERVIVSQLVRSPGIYYGIAHDKLGKKLYSATVIPNRGAWLEYETDSNDVFYVRVDRTRKVPITVLIRALGIGTNAEIIDLFGEEPKILASFGKDTAENYQEGLLELYKKIRPGEPLAVDSAESLITSMFFDPRRYDLAKVGRYKFNKKLMLKNRVTGRVLAEDVVSPITGEIVAEKGTKITREIADAIQNSAAPYLWVEGEDESRNIKILSNMMVDLQAVVDIDPKEVGVKEQVYYPVLAGIIEEAAGDIDEMKRMIKRDIHDLIPKHITKEDILASINYNMHLEYGMGNDDDIDHLGNRRIRAVGELLQNRSFQTGEGSPREDDNPGSGRNFPAVTDQHQTGDRSGEGILRILPAVTVHGSEQPAWRADPQETSVSPGTWRSVKRPCGIRGARRTLLPLRKNVPDRDSRGSEHRSDQLSCMLCKDQ